MEPNATRSGSTAWLDERYRQVIEQVEDYAIFTLNNDGFVSTWNEGAERILGFSEEEALGQPSSFIFTPEDREQGAPEQERQTAEVEGKAKDERWHVRKDGSRFFASGILTALYDKGTPDGFAKILRDLTHQKLAEEERTRLLQDLGTVTEALERQINERTQELETRNEELFQSQQRFAKAFNVGPVAACITTLGEETFLEVNDAFTELTGYTGEDVDGKTYKQLRQWSSPEDQAKLRRFGEEPFRNQEMTLHTRRGEVRTVLMSREIIELEGERLNLKQFYDITDRKRTEEELHQAVQDVMTDASWFSHQLVERLANIRSDSTKKLEVVELTKRQRQVLERMAKGMNNDAIATELELVAQTVRNYITAIYEKLGVHSRAEAVVWARERGIV